MTSSPLRLALINATTANIEETAQALRRLRGISCTVTETELHPQQSENFDVVVIYGKNSGRLDFVRRAAALKKHVLLATPGEMTAAELSAMIEICRAANVSLSVGSLRFRPSIAAVKAALESGKLGLCGLLRAHHWRPAEGDESTARLQVVQLLELAVWMFGTSPTEVYATTMDTRSGSAWPAYLQIHLGFPQHGMALLSATANLPGATEYETVSLIGSTGAAYADDQSQTQLHFRHKSPAALQQREQIPTLTAELLDFHQSVTDRRDPATNVRWLQVALELLDAVQESLAARQPIHLKDK